MKAEGSSKGEGSEALVSLEGVSRSFGKRTVLADVDMVVHSGEVVGLVGPNGGGKSTLLMMIAGLLRPGAGRVRVCGVEASALARQDAGKVGLVTARPGLYPLLTGWENLHHFGGLFGLRRAEVESRARPLLERLSLGAEEIVSSRVGTWSTGMQQKLSLVRALLLSPALLLFDEPTANVDPVVSRTLYEELRRRADEGLGCVLVTHDLQAAEAICERVLLVDGGVRKEMAFARGELPEAGALLGAWRTMLSAEVEA